MEQLRADLAIIGSGSGNSLITPFWDDKRVVIAEKGIFGGTCLNAGCIPTKMYVRPAALAVAPDEAARLGVTMRTESVDWPGIRDRIFGRIDAISAAGERYRAEELDNVALISQEVRLNGPRSFVAADGTTVEADQLVIAAGSRAVIPSIPGIDLPGVHTSDTVMRLGEQPRRVLVIGGGYIACEFAGIFSGSAPRCCRWCAASACCARSTSRSANGSLQRLRSGGSCAWAAKCSGSRLQVTRWPSR